MNRPNENMQPLSELAKEIERSIAPVNGAYVLGKTAMRDAAMRISGISAMRAERLVDAMELQGLIFHEKTRQGPQTSSRWLFK